MFDWKYWLAEFEARTPRLVIRPVPRDSTLTDEEKIRIQDSIATFQLGEQSEGHTLLRFAVDFALRRNTSRKTFDCERARERAAPL